MADVSTDTSGQDLGTLINQASGGKGGDLAAMTRLANVGLQAEQDKEKDPNIARIRAQGEGRLLADEKAVDAAYAGIEPLGDRVKPWDAKKEMADRTTSPFETFGSLGSIFAMVASAFTHTPAANAMNAMAGAINAVRANDEKAYQTAYEAWKENTHLALERHEAEYKDFSAAMEKAKTDPEIMKQELAVYAAKYDDKAAAAHLALGDFAAIEQIKNAQNSAALGWAQIRPQLEAEHEKATLAFGYDRDWANSAAGHEYFNSPEGQAWKKQNPNKIAPDNIHAMNYYAATKTATEAASPYAVAGRGSPLEQYIRQKTNEKGSAATADDIKSWTSEFNKDTSSRKQSPLDMYVAAAKKEAEDKGLPWGPDQIAESVQKYGRDSKGSLSDAGARFVAEQYLAGDRQAIVGFARNPTDKEKLTNMIADMAAERGITGPMLSVMSAEFQGLVAGERTLGTRTAQIGLAAGELSQFIPQALEASKGVPRGSYPTWNAVTLKYEEQTGDPAIKNFALALNAVENAYSQIISRGAVATDNDKKIAHALIGTVDSDEVLQVGMNRVNQEVAGAEKAPGIVRDQYRQGFLIGRGEGATGPAGQPTPGTPTAPPATAAGAKHPPIPPGVPLDKNPQWSPSEKKFYWRDDAGNWQSKAP